MHHTKSVELHTNARIGERAAPKVLIMNEENKYTVIFAYAFFILLSSFFFNTPQEIFYGILSIVLSPSILLSDYIAIGNLGAAFFNSGLLMIISSAMAKVNQTHMNGTVIAAIFTVGGFALFGKNIYNIWSIFIGVYLYAWIQKERFGKFILVALFGTALAPLTSQISFGMGLPNVMGMILGNILGVCAGFILPPLANHVIKFHQGFNIYNVGFTAGIIGTLFMAIFRSFGIEHESSHIISQGNTQLLSIYLFSIFISMLVLGFILNNGSFRGFKSILSRSGRLVTDFVTSDGFGISLMNMGLLGVVSLIYILLIGGDLNGPVIGGIFTIIGFAAFGKHLRNVLPIFIGVFLASLLQVWEVTTTATLLAALFGTTLAPIAGEFGWKWGIAAGFIHMAMVMNVGYLHGGMNLYNNGFSGGIVAAVFVPVILSLRKVGIDEE